MLQCSSLSHFLFQFSYLFIYLMMPFLHTFLLMLLPLLFAFFLSCSFWLSFRSFCTLEHFYFNFFFYVVFSCLWFAYARWLACLLARKCCILTHQTQPKSWQYQFVCGEMLLSGWCFFFALFLCLFFFTLSFLLLNH